MRRGPVNLNGFNDDDLRCGIDNQRRDDGIDMGLGVFDNLRRGSDNSFKRGFINGLDNLGFGDFKLRDFDNGFKLGFNGLRGGSDDGVDLGGFGGLRALDNSRKEAIDVRHDPVD